MKSQATTRGNAIILVQATGRSPVATPRLAALPRFLSAKVPGFPWREPVPLHGVSTIRAALTALVRNRSLTALLKDCIAFTGDMDSVAAIALGAACRYPEYQRDLSPKLLRA